jgi:endonuclease/exonuclease/phosphatase family metal-dependent hydrolase
MRRFIAAMLAALASACANGDIGGQESELAAATPRSLTVMTQNMYVGADVDPIFTAAPEEVPFLVAEAVATFEATNIYERAAAMAREIHSKHADLVALQEVSRIQIFNPDSPADFDFLPILLDALALYPDGYRVVGLVENTVADAPMITPSYDIVPVRLTDSDAILARGDVATTTIAERNYTFYLPLPIGIIVKRGYVVVDAVVDGSTYRFVGTHLEDQLLEAQLAQADELIQVLALAPEPVIVAGDFNSPAPLGDSYRMMLAAGYSDAWLQSKPEAAGLTCCQAGDLTNPVSNLDSRIDFVFTRGLDGARVKARTVGDTEEEKTPSGLWPSDHAGLVATFRRK